MYPIAEPDASQARIKGLLKLGYPALSRRDYQNNNNNNVSSPNKELFEVTFVYAGENVNDIPQQFDSQSFTNVFALEKISELRSINIKSRIC
jgi:hypothetical protein